MNTKWRKASDIKFLCRLCLQRFINLEVGMITVNLVPAVRLQTQKSQSQLFWYSSGLRCTFLPWRFIQQERNIFFCQTFLWQSFTTWLWVFARTSPANKVVTEATMLKHTHVRSCQNKITTLYFIWLTLMLCVYLCVKTVKKQLFSSPFLDKHDMPVKKEYAMWN